jgi:hypothetical protein
MPAARAETVATSINWSGYADVAGNVTGVYSTFSVPTITGPTPGLAATWAGIGGAVTGDLIQGGVEENNLPPAGPRYFAFFDLLPAGETVLIGGCNGDPTCTVRPGDIFSVDIHLADADTQTWSINLSDDGHWWASTDVQYASSQSSADWIFEATSLLSVPTVVPMTTPTLFEPLAPTAVRGNQFAVGGGRPQVLASGQPVTEQMALGGMVVEATPSPIAPDGSGFDICAFAASCPAPAA